MLIKNIIIYICINIKINNMTLYDLKTQIDNFIDEYNLNQHSLMDINISYRYDYDSNIVNVLDLQEGLKDNNKLLELIFITDTEDK